MIDLRSDTVTRPTPGMRRAIAEADVGDDVFGEDPTVAELENETARLLGKEAALYVPSGHMGNQIALYIAARSGEEVWTHTRSHVIGNEQGAGSVLARVLPRTFDDPSGLPDLGLLSEWSAGADDLHRARPALLCLENTMTGLVLPPEKQRRVTGFAREHGLRTHLDGARLWNAAAALDTAPAEIAEGFDTVSVCFSKGLGAPVGSALAGDAATIDRARRARKLLGGGMRQVGMVAAGACYALRHHRERIAEDHERAARLAAGLAGVEGLEAVARTNMVLLTTPAGAASRLVAAVERRGIRCVAIGPDLVRLVVHLEIGDADIEETVARISAVARSPQ